MNTTAKVIAAGVGGLVVGAVSTYFLTQRRLEIKYSLILESEIDKLKEYYRLVLKKDGRIVIAGEEEDEELETTEDWDPEDVIVSQDEEQEESEFSQEDKVEYEALIKKNNYLSVAAEQEERNRNAFESPDVDENEVGEEVDGPLPMLPERDPDHPYIISHDQWAEDYYDNTRYEKITLRYFEDDNTLCSELDTPIVDVEGTVGLKNLNKFGLGSEDEAIVYVRNEVVETDFEIIHDPGAYTQVILGIPVDYTRETKSKIKKMRDDE